MMITAAAALAHSPFVWLIAGLIALVALVAEIVERRG